MKDRKEKTSTSQKASIFRNMYIGDDFEPKLAGILEKVS